MRAIIFSFLFFMPMHLMAGEQTNVLIPGETIQVTSNISNEYRKVTPGLPIQGTITVTHDSNQKVDQGSFKMGSTPIKVEFVQNVAMSSFNNLIISFYKFTLDGKKLGIYTLDPITVVVGGKTYQAPPMTIEVGS